MLYRLLYLIVLLLALTTASAQERGRAQADSMLRRLGLPISDTGRIYTLLNFAKFLIDKPGSEKADEDSARDYLNRAAALNASVRSEDARAYIMMIRSCFYYDQGHSANGFKNGYEQATAGIALDDSAIHILQTGDNGYILAEAWLFKSQHYDLFGFPDSAITAAKTVLAIFEKAGNIKRIADGLVFLGSVYVENHRDSAGIAVFYRALALYQSVHYDQLYVLYGYLARAYYHLGNYTKSLRYAFPSIDLYEAQNPPPIDETWIYLTTAQIFVRLNDLQKAFDYFKKGIVTADRDKDGGNEILCKTGIVSCDISLGNYKQALVELQSVEEKYKSYRVWATDYSYLEIYLHLGDFEKGQVYANKLLRLTTSSYWSGSDAKGNIYDILIRFYIASGQYALAKKDLQLESDLIKRDYRPAVMARNLKNWFTLDSLLKDYKASTFHLLAYHRINDSIFSADQSKQLAQMQVQYQTERSENEIKLQQKDILLLNQENRRVTVARNVTLGGLGLLAVIIGLLYRQYRLKQKSNRVTQQKNAIITQKNGQLGQLVTEKEWLLKEVNHRVNNNLHMVIALLKSQAEYLEDDALEAIQNSQHRIYAMSLIHQKLYKSADVKTVDMASYLPEFISYLQESFGTRGLIRFRQAIEPLKMGITQAIPLALIVNEAATNAIKYAFPGGGEGVIFVCLKRVEDLVTLVIADDGIGIDPAIVGAPSESLGLKLMIGLSEDIEGRISIENDNGTRICVVFKPDPFDSAEDPTGVALLADTAGV
jgi:two-component sensor histidine kinase